MWLSTWTTQSQASLPPGIRIGEKSDPFIRYTDQVIDLTRYVDLRSGKDYRFIGAISGLRNRTEIEPLFPLRGLPEFVNAQIRGELCLEENESPDEGRYVGWLYLEEVEAAISHQGFTKEDLSLAVNVLLEIMSYLEKKIGKKRVRLVFEITD